MAEDFGGSVPTTEEIYGHVGRKLRALRVERGLTQSQVAHIIGTSPQQYQKYEDAQSKCSLPYLLTLARYYVVDITDLLPSGPDLPPDDKVSVLRRPVPEEDAMANEADLLARLVSAFVRVDDPVGKLRLVQLVETMSRDASNRPLKQV